MYIENNKSIIFKTDIIYIFKSVMTNKLFKKY